MHLANPARRSLVRLAQLLPIGALLAVPLAVTGMPGSTPSAHAAQEDRTTAQWNMQGQNHRGENRWTNGVQQWLQHADIVGLQEAGNAPPERAHWNHDRFVGRGVTEHTMELGTEGPVNIYWADVGQQRNQLAIATRETATDVVQLPVHNGGADDSRPIMGVRIGDDWYFNGHARSGGNSNVVDMYETARQYMRQRGVADQDWHFIGDFNTAPANLPGDLQNRVVAAGLPTQQGGNELDYTLEGAPTNNTDRAQRHFLNSDHYGLLIDHQGCRKRDMRCQAPLAGHTYRFFADLDSRSVISRGDDADPAPRAYWPRRDKDNPDYTVQLRYSTQQGEYLLAYGEKSDACIERDGNDTVTRACDPENKAQHWKLDGSRLIQNPDNPGYLQPGEGGGLITRAWPYTWTHRPMDYQPTRDELKRREENPGADVPPDPEDENPDVGMPPQPGGENPDAAQPAAPEEENPGAARPAQPTEQNEHPAADAVPQK